jgi:hypothetical protein
METGYYLSFICRFKYHSFESLYIHNIGGHSLKRMTRQEVEWLLEEIRKVKGA